MSRSGRLMGWGSYKVAYRPTTARISLAADALHEVRPVLASRDDHVIAFQDVQPHRWQQNRCFAEYTRAVSILISGQSSPASGISSQAMKSPRRKHIQVILELKGAVHSRVFLQPWSRTAGEARSRTSVHLYLTVI
jgi:hypothetical protein